jgi:protein tyrosine kinase modulator
MSEPEATDYVDSPGRDPFEYLEIPLRYPRHMWIPFCVVLALAVGLGMTFPRKYRSATLILVEPNKVPDYFVTPMASETVDKRLQTIRQVILSRTRLEKVLDEVKPDPDMEGLPLSVVVEAMRRAIHIQVQGNDSFSIEYVNRDPKKAAKVTNMLAEQFIEDTRYLRDNLTQQTREFIESNLDEARQTLEAREAALRRIKQQHWGALPEQLDTNLKMLAQLQFEQQTHGENLRTLEGRRAVLEGALVERRREGAPPGMEVADSDPRVQLAKLQAQYAALRDRYTDEHPDAKAVKMRIARLEQQIESAAKAGPEAPSLSATATDPQVASLEQSLQRLEIEIDAVKVRRDKLDVRLADLQRRVEQTPRVEQELMAVTRDYQQLKESYTGLVRKDMDARMARRMEEHWQGKYFRILDPAPVPERPIRPYGLMFAGGGFVLAIFTGLFSAFVADLLDDSVKSPRALQALLPQPLLAVMPRATAATGRTSAS